MRTRWHRYWHRRTDRWCILWWFYRRRYNGYCNLKQKTQNLTRNLHKITASPITNDIPGACGANRGSFACGGFVWGPLGGKDGTWEVRGGTFELDGGNAGVLGDNNGAWPLIISGTGAGLRGGNTIGGWKNEPELSYHKLKLNKFELTHNFPN